MVILLVIIGIFFFPSTSGGSIAQVSGTKPMEVDILVRGLSVRDPDAFIGQLEEEKQINIVIRNQPAGQLEIKSVQPLPRTTPVAQPDGSVKALPDPRPEVVFIKDMIITVGGNAQISDNGPVLGGKKSENRSPNSVVRLKLRLQRQCNGCAYCQITAIYECQYSAEKRVIGNR